jgi:hypothetical protein
MRGPGRSPGHFGIRRPGHLGNALGRHGPGNLEDTEGSGGGSAQTRCESHGRTRAQALLGTVSGLFCPTSGPKHRFHALIQPLSARFSRLFSNALRTGLPWLLWPESSCGRTGLPAPAHNNRLVSAYIGLVPEPDPHCAICHLQSGI